jgi:hypothetical protein
MWPGGLGRIPFGTLLSISINDKIWERHAKVKFENWRLLQEFNKNITEKYQNRWNSVVSGLVPK